MCILVLVYKKNQAIFKGVMKASFNNISKKMNFPEL